MIPIVHSFEIESIARWRCITQGNRLLSEWNDWYLQKEIFGRKSEVCVEIDSNQLPLFTPALADELIQTDESIAIKWPTCKKVDVNYFDPCRRGYPRKAWLHFNQEAGGLPYPSQIRKNCLFVIVKKELRLVQHLSPWLKPNYMPVNFTRLSCLVARKRLYDCKKWGDRCWCAWRCFIEVTKKVTVHPKI